MHVVPAAALLKAWEQGHGQHPLYRALTLLRVASPEQSLDELAMLSIGERDRRLVLLRRSLLGNSFEAVASCPKCGQRLDLAFESNQLPLNSAQSSASVKIGRRMLEIRLPTTADLLDATSESLSDREAFLFARCASSDLTAEEREEVERQLSELDAMANIHLDLTCPACANHWREIFDIASYLWSEIADRAQRLVGEVHVLARAYGWSESAILNLSARRRRAYLDLAVGV